MLTFMRYYDNKTGRYSNYKFSNKHFMTVLEAKFPYDTISREQPNQNNYIMAEVMLLRQVEFSEFVGNLFMMMQNDINKSVARINHSEKYAVYNRRRAKLFSNTKPISPKYAVALYNRLLGRQAAFVHKSQIYEISNYGSTLYYVSSSTPLESFRLACKTGDTKNIEHFATLAGLTLAEKTTLLKLYQPITNSPTMEDVYNDVRNGLKINAIKTYRSINPCSLPQAKEAVDLLFVKYHQTGVLY